MRVDQRERIVVQKYNVYISKDGKEFTSEEECINHEKILDGTRIICPSCGGKGSWKGKNIPYALWNNSIKVYYEQHTCAKCKGKGYLDKKIIWE